MTVYNSISIVFAIVIFLFILYLGLKTDLLREQKKIEDRISPYSFSRFQFWLWLLVISPIFILYWGFTKNHIPDINRTSLILVTLSSGAAIISAIVSKSQEDLAKRNNPDISLKKMNKTNSFWTDLLKDDNDQLSIGRLQQLIFTIIFVVIYITLFFSSNMEKYPVFENYTFILMGISSATYLAAKGSYK